MDAKCIQEYKYFNNYQETEKNGMEWDKTGQLDFVRHHQNGNREVQRRT